MRNSSYSFGDSFNIPFSATLTTTADQNRRINYRARKHRKLALDQQLMPQTARARMRASSSSIPNGLVRIVVGAEIERLHLDGLVAPARQHPRSARCHLRSRIIRNRSMALDIWQAPRSRMIRAGALGQQFRARSWPFLSFDDVVTFACSISIRSNLRIGGSSSMTRTLDRDIVHAGGLLVAPTTAGISNPMVSTAS